VLDAKEENGKELEEEDDLSIRFIINSDFVECN
jgi:hypothetical protein